MFEEAVLILERLIKKHPKDPLYIIERGHCALNMGCASWESSSSTSKVSDATAPGHETTASPPCRPSSVTWPSVNRHLHCTVSASLPSLPSATSVVRLSFSRRKRPPPSWQLPIPGHGSAGGTGRSCSSPSRRDCATARSPRFDARMWSSAPALTSVASERVARCGARRYARTSSRRSRNGYRSGVAIHRIPSSPARAARVSVQMPSRDSSPDMQPPHVSPVRLSLARR